MLAVTFLVTATTAVAWEPKRPVEFIVPAGTGGGADIMAGEIADAVKSRKELKIFDSDKHGTDIFKDEPQLIHEIVEWLALD